MPITEQLLYQTDKSSHLRCSIKKMLFVKILHFSQEPPVRLQHRFWDEVEIKLQAVKQASLLKRESNTDVFL